MKFLLSPEVMDRMIKRLLWRRIIEEISGSLVRTRSDKHYFAVSVYQPFSNGSQPVSLRSVSKILGCSLPDAHSYVTKHTELIVAKGSCSVCKLASIKLKRKLRTERERADNKDWLLLSAWKLY
jgi:hypothetical protein